MDPAVQGAIIGASIALAASILTAIFQHYLSGRRYKQELRDQQAAFERDLKHQADVYERHLLDQQAKWELERQARVELLERQLRFQDEQNEQQAQEQRSQRERDEQKKTREEMRADLTAGIETPKVYTRGSLLRRIEEASKQDPALASQLQNIHILRRHVVSAPQHGHTDAKTRLMLEMTARLNLVQARSDLENAFDEIIRENQIILSRVEYRRLLDDVLAEILEIVRNLGGQEHSGDMDTEEEQA